MPAKTARSSVLLLGLALAPIIAHSPRAQPGAGAPPAVGVFEARRQAVTQTNEFNGHIEAINGVSLVPRVTAFLEKQLSTEGAEVKKGDLLCQLEKGPFQADVAAKQAQVAQLEATLVNARLTTERARTLLGGPAGLQSNYDARLPTSAASKRRYRARRRSCNRRKSISATPTSIRQSTAEQVAPRSRLATSSVQAPAH